MTSSYEVPSVCGLNFVLHGTRRTTYLDSQGEPVGAAMKRFKPQRWPDD